MYMDHHVSVPLINHCSMFYLPAKTLEVLCNLLVQGNFNLCTSHTSSVFLFACHYLFCYCSVIVTP